MNNPINQFCCERPKEFYDKPGNEGRKICCEFPDKKNKPGFCKTDRECQTRSPGMDCVRSHRTVFSKVDKGTMTVYYYEKENEGGKCTLALTAGEQEICKRDEDCHRNNPDMVCVRHYGTVITKIVNGNMVANVNLHETETGKCTLENKLPNIVDSAAATPELSTLFTAIGASGLVDTLKGDGPFTVFAPNNDAFAKMPKNDLADLLKPENVDKLKAVLLRHVVPGEIKAASISGGTTKLETAGGEEISVVKTKGVQVKSLVGQANVIKTDSMARNGVIHLVDSVF